MKYSFILEIDDISKDDINELVNILSDNKIKFHVLKSDKELKENQKYKEVINKAIALLEDDNICADIRRNKPIDDNRGLPFPKCIVEYGVEKELLSILKEVEHE